MFKFTKRVLRVIRETERTIHLHRDILTPVDLFFGGLLERSGALGELSLKCSLNLLIQYQAGMRFSTEMVCKACSISPFEMKVSESLIHVLGRAEEISKSYHQCLINEGHLYSALLESREIRELFRSCDLGFVENDVLEIVCSPRDMAVPLKHLTKPKDSVLGEVLIRRAENEDYNDITVFVKKEFGDRWISAVHTGFEKSTISIFIAKTSDEIVGFGCYDVAHTKKGVFGPMGTSIHFRQTGVGKALLEHCLYEMQRIGYDYAIIKNAGPIEFYETSCGAVLIRKV